MLSPEVSVGCINQLQHIAHARVYGRESGGGSEGEGGDVSMLAPLPDTVMNGLCTATAQVVRSLPCDLQASVIANTLTLLRVGGGESESESGGSGTATDTTTTTTAAADGGEAIKTNSSATTWEAVSANGSELCERVAGTALSEHASPAERQLSRLLSAAVRVVDAAVLKPISVVEWVVALFACGAGGDTAGEDAVAAVATVVNKCEGETHTRAHVQAPHTHARTHTCTHTYAHTLTHV